MTDIPNLQFSIRNSQLPMTDHPPNHVTQVTLQPLLPPLKIPPRMNSNYRVRRATLDDIGALSALWNSMKFPVEDLARRVTEFQVAEDPQAKIVGAVGLQIAERQGLINSEAFTDFALADQLRPLLWDRIHSVATNHGLLRLWTSEQAPFWNHCGLTKADPDSLQKLPAPWRAKAANWLTLKLKDDIESVLSMDKEFAMFMQAEKDKTARTFQQARVLKFVATLIALAVFGMILLGLMFLVRHNPHIIHR